MTRSTSSVLWLLGALTVGAACGEGFTSVETSSGTATGGAAASNASSSVGNDPSCDCDAPSFFVCGEDGVTYDIGCGEQCGPEKVDCDNKCPCGICDNLEDEYALHLEEARACTMLEGPCLQEVSDGLQCPCTTFVHPNNGTAIGELQRVQNKWHEHACGQDANCPTVECPTVVNGTCEQVNDGGRCQDLFAG